MTAASTPQRVASYNPPSSALSAIGAGHERREHAERAVAGGALVRNPQGTTLRAAPGSVVALTPSPGGGAA